MRKKIKKYKKIKITNKDKIIILIILVFIGIYSSFLYINDKIMPTLNNYASQEIIKITSQIVNLSINKEITDQIDIENLFLINKNINEEINTIDFNPIIVNKLLTSVTTNIYENLIELENGVLNLNSYQNDPNLEYKNENNGVIFYIPSLLPLNNSLLSNLGPKIPVRLNLVGNVISNIKTEIKEYGINNALLEVFIEVETSVQVIMPFLTEKITIDSKIPISIKLINGSVPEYYANGINENSSILSIPVD